MKNHSILLTLPKTRVNVIPTSFCSVVNLKGWEFTCGSSVIEGIVDYSKRPIPVKKALENAIDTRTTLCSICEFSAACCSYAGVLSAGGFLDTSTQITEERALPVIFAPGLCC